MQHNRLDTLLYGEDYSTKTHQFIKWFFVLLASFIAGSLIILFTIRINDTVSFTEGEIVSQSPQFDMKAPYEAQLSKLLVHEGQKVTAGDTLMIIYNESNNRQYIAQKAEKEYLEKKLLSFQSLNKELTRKKNETGVENNLNNADSKLNIDNAKHNIEALTEQYRIQQEKLKTALERNRADSILYSKDMLSKLEYNTGKDATNDIRETLNNTKRELEKQKMFQQANSNEYATKQHALTLKKIELEENSQSIDQLKIDLQNELVKATENLALLERELAKQYLIATTNGTILFVFNAKQASDYINKNDLLLSISPDKNDFYAKVALPENNVQYVKTNMQAHLELDAYYHLEYGILKGDVTYVSARKENDKFYAFIKLDNAKQFNLKPGYNISGEIITERLFLFQYFIKKLFKEFDNKQA